MQIPVEAEWLVVKEKGNVDAGHVCVNQIFSIFEVCQVQLPPAEDICHHKSESSPASK